MAASGGAEPFTLTSFASTEVRAHVTSSNGLLFARLRKSQGLGAVIGRTNYTLWTEVALDQWHLSLGDEVPRFMEQSIANADYVLLICTESYVRKADARIGGAGYESMQMAAELSQLAAKDKSRLIPVVRQTTHPRQLPRFVAGRYYADLSADAPDPDAAYDELLRKLHGAPKHRAPPLGTNPFSRLAAGEAAAPIHLVPRSEATDGRGERAASSVRQRTWTKGERIGLFALVIAIATLVVTALTVPGMPKLLHWDKSAAPTHLPEPPAGTKVGTAAGSTPTATSDSSRPRQLVPHTRSQASTESLSLERSPLPIQPLAPGTPARCAPSSRPQQT